MIWPRMRAWALLATAWLLMFSSRLLGLGSRYGLAAFERNYRADRVTPLSNADREVLLQAGRCMACGRCEQGGAALDPTGATPGLMTLVLAGTRNQPDFEEAAAAWSELDPTELANRQLLCPTRVPIAALAEVVQRLGKASAGSHG